MLKNRYKYTKTIAENNFNVVNEGIDTFKNIPVAIKRTKNKNEFKICQKIMEDKNVSEHILKIFDAFEEDGTFYIVSELCDCNLLTFLNNYDLTHKQRILMLRSILLGLHWLHTNGIIHRDIKLSNILLLKDSIKICDFGAACYESDKEELEKLVGTSGYMAPEMIKKEMIKKEMIKKENEINSLTENQYNIFGHKLNSITSKVDIYSFGIVMKYFYYNQNSSDASNIIQECTQTNINTRPTAFVILQNNFQSIYPSIKIDFLKMEPFEKESKYGRISRKENYFEIVNQTIELRIFKEELKSQYQIKINNETKQAFELSNTELKYYIYLILFMEKVAAQTVLDTIASDDYVFEYFLNDTWKYRTNNYKTNRFEIYFCDEKYFINGQEYKDLPQTLMKLKEYIDTLILRSKNKNNLNTHKIKINSEIADEKYVQHKKTKENKEMFVEKVGWGFKKENYLKIFLINGNRITKNMDTNEIFIDGQLVHKFNVNYKTITKIIELFTHQ